MCVCGLGCVPRRDRRVHSRLCTSLLQMPLAYWQCQQGGIRGSCSSSFASAADLVSIILVQSAFGAAWLRDSCAG